MHVLERIYFATVFAAAILVAAPAVTFAQKNHQRQAKQLPPPPAPALTVPPVSGPEASDPFVIVRSPQDSLPLDSKKVHVVTIAVNYHAVIILPVGARQLIAGNLEYFRAWALEEEGESLTAASEIKGGENIKRNARFLLVKPVQPVEQVVGGVKIPVETSLTIRLESEANTEKLLFLRLKLGPPEQNVYRVTFRDETLETQQRRAFEAAERQARDKQKQEAALQQTREEAAGKVKNLLGTLASGNALSTELASSREEMEGVEVLLIAGRSNSYLYGGIQLVRHRGTKPLGLTSPSFKLDGTDIVPDREGELPGSITKTSAVMGWKLTVKRWSGDLAQGDPQRLMVQLTIGGKPVILNVNLGGLAIPVQDSTKPELTAEKPKIGSQPDSSLHPAGEIKPSNEGKQSTNPPLLSEITLAEAQKRLEYLLTITSVRSTNVTTATTNSLTAAVRGERYGQYFLVVLCVERKIGNSELTMSPPKWTSERKPINLAAIIRPLPGLLGTRPLISGFVLEIGDSTIASCDFTVGKEPVSLRQPVPPAAPLMVATEIPSVQPNEPPAVEIPASGQPAKAGGAGSPNAVEPKAERVRIEERQTTDLPQGKTQPDNSPPSTEREVGKIRLTKGTRSEPKNNRKPPAQPSGNPLALAALGCTTVPLKRLVVDGTVVKLLEVRKSENRMLVILEVVNGNTQVLSDMELVAVQKIAADGMTATRIHGAIEKYIERPLLEQGDHSRLCFSFPENQAPLSKELQWKMGSVTQSVQLP